MIEAVILGEPPPPRRVLPALIGQDDDAEPHIRHG